MMNGNYKGEIYMRKKQVKRNFLKGFKVIIKQHVIDQYMARAGVSEREAKETLERKFRNTYILTFKSNGAEIRKEIDGSKNKKLNFVAYKRNKTFIVVTCYLQGAKNNWWKNEGIIEVNRKEVPYDEITEELKNYFEEVSG